MVSYTHSGIHTMEELHVFGYGSLMWKPDFHYTTREHGYIRGYQRRFWQSNTEQRGTDQKVNKPCVLYTTHIISITTFYYNYYNIALHIFGFCLYEGNHFQYIENL